MFKYIYTYSIRITYLENTVSVYDDEEDDTYVSAHSLWCSTSETLPNNKLDSVSVSTKLVFE